MINKKKTAFWQSFYIKKVKIYSAVKGNKAI